jgi:hypothetical protein
MLVAGEDVQQKSSLLVHDIKRSDQIPDEAHKAASRLPDRLGVCLVSLIYYPEKSYRGGLVVLFRDDADPLVDLVTEVFICVPLDHRRDVPLCCMKSLITSSAVP